MDETGLPVRVSISPGQASDTAAAPALIVSLTRAAHVVAVRGEDAMALVDRIEARGALARIPTRRDRKVQRSVDRTIYRQRNLMERQVSNLKHVRRIATRFGKLAVTFLSAVARASAGLWTRAHEATT
ncbi:MAG: transposase [Pseudomonadota bacterium]